MARGGAPPRGRRGADCGRLRARYRRDGFAVAAQLVSPEALREAWEHGAAAAVAAGRFGGAPGAPAAELLEAASLPPGLREASDVNLIHNGFLLAGVRSIWPLLTAAAGGARCLLGLAGAGERAGPDAASAWAGLRLNVHLRLAPKVAGVEHQHVLAHQDAAYWAHKFSSEEDLDSFANATVSAWVPLTDVGLRRGAMAYERGSHRRGFLGRGRREAAPGLPTRRLVQPALAALDEHIAAAAAGGAATGGARLAQVVPARRGDVLFHHLYTAHGPLRMPPNASRVRWVLEARFHAAEAVDRFRAAHEELFPGPRLDGVGQRSAYGALLHVAAIAALHLHVAPLHSETRRSVLLGSGHGGRMQLPLVGLGTGRLLPHQVAAATALFLSLGGRHIDTALDYGNHEAVSQACDATGVQPRELAITTKVFPLGFDQAFSAVTRSLRELNGAGQVVALLHWPGASRDGRGGEPLGIFRAAGGVPEACREQGRPNSWRRCRAESYRALLALRRAGLISACGVSNFTPRQLAELRADLADAPADAQQPPWPPDVLQTEVHPWWREDQLVSLCATEGVQVVAYASLGSPEEKVFSLADPTVRRIAEEAGLTPAQVLLRWAIQTGLRVIPTTASEAHMREALEAAEEPAALSPEAMRSLGSLPQLESRVYAPDPEGIE